MRTNPFRIVANIRIAPSKPIPMFAHLKSSSRSMFVCAIGMAFAIPLCCSANLAFAQDLKTALQLESKNERKYSLARIEALATYLRNPRASEANAAIRCYIRNAIRTGHAKQAVRYSSDLMDQADGWLDKANHVKCLCFAGDLDASIRLATNVLANKAKWSSDRDAERIQQTIDVAIEREIEIVFRIDAARIEGQYDLRPNIWIPIPWRERENISCNVEVTGAKHWKIQTEHETEFLEIEPVAFDQPVTVTANLLVKPINWSSRMQDAEWGYSAFQKNFTLPSHYIDSDNLTIVAVAKTLISETPFETVAKTLKHCSESNHYVPGDSESDGGGRASEVGARGYGHCEGQSQFAAALLRANDIPARLIRGHSAMLGDTPQGSHHTILEYYLDGVGWISWDWGQAPGVVPASFVPMWSYPNFSGSPEPKQATAPLHFIQRLGLRCQEYMTIRVIKRFP